MSNEDLRVRLGVDVDGVLQGMQRANKSLQDFKDQAARFKAALDKSTDPKSIERLNRALEASAAKIKAIQSAGTGGLGKLANSSDQAAQSLTNLGRIAQDAPFGFIGIQNNINPLLESFQRLKGATGSTGSALKALGASLVGPAGLGLAVSLVTSVLTVLSQKGLLSFESAASKAAQEAKEFKKSLNEVEAQGISTGLMLQGFVNIARNGNLPLKERNEALKEANKILGEHGEKLTLVNVATAEVTEQVKKFTEATIQSTLATKFADRIADLIIRERDAIKDVTKATEKQAKAQQQLNDVKNIRGLGEANPQLAASAFLSSTTRSLNDAKAALASVRKDIIDLTQQLEDAQGASSKLFGELGNKEKAKKAKETIADVVADLYKKLGALQDIEINFKTSKTKEKISAYLSTIEKLITDFKPSKSLIDGLFGEVGTLKIKSFLATVQAKIKEERPVEIPFEFAPKLSGEKALIPRGVTSVINTQMVSDLDAAAKIAFLKSQKVTTALQDGLKVGVAGLRFPQLNVLYEDVKARVENLNQALSGLIKGVFVDAFVGVGDAIGALLGGSGIKDAFSSFFGSLIESLGVAIRTFGIQALAATKVILAIKATLGKVPGIGVAIGAIALGTAIKILGSKLKTPAFADGVTGFAGGLAMVGERGPELVRLPSGADVIPNHSLGSAAIGGGMSVDVNGNFRVAGTDLVLVLERANKSLNRQG